MIRVAYLITDSGVGGTEKMLAELILNLDRSRFSPELIVLKAAGETAATLSEKGIDVKSAGLPGRLSAGYAFRMPAALFRLSRMLAESKPDILHCFLFQANFLGRIAARLAGVPVNISSLRVEERERGSHIMLERLSTSLVTAYTAVCDRVRDFGIQKTGMPPEKIVTVLNGIDPGPYALCDRDKVRKELGIEAGAPLVGTVGRIHRQKGMDVFLRAVAACREKVPELRALVVGEGPEERNLRVLAEELGVADRVLFTGLRRDIPDLLCALDLFILASRWEGMPNVILEAMAAGRAVVATDAGGARDLVRRGETGEIVPVEDAHSLAGAMMELLAKGPDLVRMGERAREIVKKGYTIERMVERNQGLYERLVRDVRHMR